MSLLSVIEDRLRDDPSFVADAGGRIGTSRSLAKLPGVTMQTVSGSRTDHFKGEQPAETMVQIDAWARTEPEAAALRERAIEVLRPAGIFSGMRFFRARVTNIRSGMEPGQQPNTGPSAARTAPEIYRESIDFIFTHTPG